MGMVPTGSDVFQGFVTAPDGSVYKNTLHTFGVGGDGWGGQPLQTWSTLDLVTQGTLQSPTAIATSTGVNPTETSYALYGHTVPLLVIGKARIGSEIISGPWMDGGATSGIVSCGVEADPTRTRTLVELAFDSEVVWTAADGFRVEPFTFRFISGTYTQDADALEIAHFGAEAIAYRPQILIAIENLPLANTKFQKFPYVSAVILDQDGEAINFGESFERLAASPWVDFADFETSGLTDGVPNGGLIIAQDTQFLQLLQDFGRFYPTWDILQTDKLRIVDRGDTVAADIILNPTRLMDGITINRQGQDTAKKDLELSTIDPDADYTIVPSLATRPRYPVAVTTSIGKDTAYLPVIMDAATRQAMVTLALYHEDATRKTISGTAMAYGLEIEPGALVAIRNLSADFYNETFKIVETLHGANNTVEFTAQSILKCAIEVEDAEGIFVSASDTRYGISTTMNQDIPACDVDDMLIAAVMHRSALTTLAGWNLVDTVTSTSSGGSHSLSLFSRLAQLGDSGATTTWTQASSVRISVHIQAFRSPVRTLTVVDSATNKIDNTSATSIDTAIVATTGDGQIGVAFATSALASGLLPTGLTVAIDDGPAHQTTVLPTTFLADNRLCGGYAILNLGDTTAGSVGADYTPTSGGAWAAVSLVLG